uniref:Putative ovule protein n=1 Tax=Solanum chacoense TaxID=4108 RepID=A0A0V0GW08_SOLCH
MAWPLLFWPFLIVPLYLCEVGVRFVYTLPPPDPTSRITPGMLFPFLIFWSSQINLKLNVKFWNLYIILG